MFSSSGRGTIPQPGVLIEALNEVAAFGFPHGVPRSRIASHFTKFSRRLD
jgi:hypothetical protein